MTRAAFIAAYRHELTCRYAWACIASKLDRFMESVSATLAGDNSWNHTGEAVVIAWRLIGGRGKPTLKALRALP